MGECKLVSTEELLKDNPIYCLSALRVFDQCYKCPEYADCESKRINKVGEAKINRIESLTQTIKKLKGELEEAKKEVKNEN